VDCGVGQRQRDLSALVFLAQKCDHLVTKRAYACSIAFRAALRHAKRGSGRESFVDRP